MRGLALLVGALVAVVVCGCGGSGGNGGGSGGGDGGGDADGAGDPIRVVATVGMVADMVRAVGGDRAEVVGLIGSGVDPHLYSATRSDVGRLMDADVVFYNGLLLEGKLTDALIRAAGSGKRVVAVTEGLGESELLSPEGVEGLHDPHVWMDPSLWSRCVGVVRDAMIAHDPGGAEAYRANAEAYVAELVALDAYAERVLGTVDEGQRVLVTAHDAFGYFGRRYGFEVVGIQGLSTESEAGSRDIELLVDLLVERGIGAVFVESTVSERNIEAVVSGAAARGHRVVIGGELFSDAMGAAESYEGTYVGMIDHNVTVIARALGGDAPAGGMSGRLSSAEGAAR
ncbi:MAG: metal ABC transporter solute-binding protein, Zn/Mn family [Phycisphaerales bacterium]